MIKSKRLKRTCHAARMEEGMNAFKILTGQPIRRRPLGRPRRIWEDSISIDLKK